MVDTPKDASSSGSERSSQPGFIRRLWSALCRPSAHDMRDTVYQEYRQTIHFSNRTGVRAICSDCHVPKDWVHKVVRKVKASGELYGKITGVIDTPETFEAHRAELAKRVWTTMQETDSRECRNCHSFDGMNPEK